MKNFTLIELLTVLSIVAILVFVVAIPLGVWDNPEDSATALKKAGFTEIVIGEHNYFACGRGDVSSLAFAADNPKCDRVTGTVCCGWWKSCTIRF